MGLGADNKLILQTVSYEDMEETQKIDIKMIGLFDVLPSDPQEELLENEQVSFCHWHALHTCHLPV